MPAFRLLMRPAHPSWRQVATNTANQKRQGKSKSFGSESILDLLKQFFTAFVKAPESKPKNQDSQKELSSLDQANLDAIDDKTRYPGFEVQIRIVASSQISTNEPRLF